LLISEKGKRPTTEETEGPVRRTLGSRDPMLIHDDDDDDDDDKDVGLIPEVF
jgi:hypothetical protein